MGCEDKTDGNNIAKFMGYQILGNTLIIKLN